MVIKIKRAKRNLNFTTLYFNINTYSEVTITQRRRKMAYEPSVYIPISENHPNTYISLQTLIPLMSFYDHIFLKPQLQSVRDDLLLPQPKLAHFVDKLQTFWFACDF